MERVVITTGPEETIRLGVEVAQDLRNGDVVALSGELGTGKTTFVQGIAQGLFVSALVLSPSFLLLRSYRGRIPLYHIDAYRINRPEELFEVGLIELLPPEEGVTVVEWADRIEPLIPKWALWVRFWFFGDKRKIELSRFQRRRQARALQKKS